MKSIWYLLSIIMSHLILLLLTGWYQEDILSIYIYLFGLSVMGILHWIIYYCFIDDGSNRSNDNNNNNNNNNRPRNNDESSCTNNWSLYKIWIYAILLHVIMNMLTLVIYFKIVHSFFIHNNGHIQNNVHPHITVETSTVESVNSINDPFHDFMMILYWIYYAFINNNFVSIMVVQLVLLFGLYEMETVNQALENCDDKYVKRDTIVFGFAKYYLILIGLVIHRVAVVLFALCLDYTPYFSSLMDNVTNNLWNGYGGIKSDLGSNRVFVQFSSKNHFFLDLIFLEHQSFILSTVIMCVQYCLIRYYCQCKNPGDKTKRWDNHFIFQQCIIMYFINWRNLPKTYLLSVALYFLIFFLISYYRRFATTLVLRAMNGFYNKNNTIPTQNSHHHHHKKIVVQTNDTVKVNNHLVLTMENEVGDNTSFDIEQNSIRKQGKAKNIIQNRQHNSRTDQTQQYHQKFQYNNVQYNDRDNGSYNDSY